MPAATPPPCLDRVTKKQRNQQKYDQKLLQSKPWAPPGLPFGTLGHPLADLGPLKVKKGKSKARVRIGDRVPHWPANGGNFVRFFVKNVFFDRLVY